MIEEALAVRRSLARMGENEFAGSRQQVVALKTLVEQHFTPDAWDQFRSED